MILTSIYLLLANACVYRSLYVRGYMLCLYWGFSSNIHVYGDIHLFFILNIHMSLISIYLCYTYLLNIICVLSLTLISIYPKYYYSPYVFYPAPGGCSPGFIHAGDITFMCRTGTAVVYAGIPYRASFILNIMFNIHTIYIHSLYSIYICLQSCKSTLISL